MGNIDEKRLSALLERISNIKVEIEALEKEVLGLVEISEPLSPVSEHAEEAEHTEVTASAAQQSSPTIEALAPTDVSAVPTDDTPIEIDIQGIDIPPVIEDPVADYSSASTSTSTDDVPVTEPTSQVTDSVKVTVPVKTPELTEAATQAQTPANQPDDDLPFDDDFQADGSSAFSEPIAEPLQEPKLDIEQEIVINPTSKETEATPKVKTVIMDSQKAETAVMDVMAEKQAWRTDRPGSQVKNVISAISLNDRVLLINVLFREDPLLFQRTISAFNDMSTLNEALAYIQANFPDWDMNSEPVYRLMMAVRRKLR